MTPWGAPSDEILFAEIAGLPVRFRCPSELTILTLLRKAD